MSKVSVARLITLLSCFAIYLDLSAGQPKQPAPFKMQLLPGYHIEPYRNCIDTRCGQIKKWFGRNVEYDMGGDLWGDRSYKPIQDWKRECSWRENENSKTSTGTGDVDCYIDDLHTDGTKLFVTFPNGTRFFVRIKNQKQVQQLLKMLLTYDPRVEEKTSPTTTPADGSRGSPASPAGPPPR